MAFMSRDHVCHGFINITHKERYRHHEDNTAHEHEDNIINLEPVKILIKILSQTEDVCLLLSGFKTCVCWSDLFLSGLKILVTRAFLIKS